MTITISTEDGYLTCADDLGDLEISKRITPEQKGAIDTAFASPDFWTMFQESLIGAIVVED